MRFSIRQLGGGTLLSLALVAPLMQGCTTVQDSRVVAAQQDMSFKTWLNGLLVQIKANPKYDRLPINSKAQEEQFLVWLHDAFRGEISKHDLMRNINSTYPGHEYETSYIVSRLP